MAFLVNKYFHSEQTSNALFQCFCSLKLRDLNRRQMYVDSLINCRLSTNHIFTYYLRSAIEPAGSSQVFPRSAAYVGKRELLDPEC